MSKIPVPKSAEEAYRRAGGRRRYHAQRRREAEERRARVAELVMQWGWVQGTQARIARELGVSEATISRDMRRIYLALRRRLDQDTSPRASAEPCVELLARGLDAALDQLAGGSDDTDWKSYPS